MAIQTYTATFLDDGSTFEVCGASRISAMKAARSHIRFNLGFDRHDPAPKWSLKVKTGENR